MAETLLAVTKGTRREFTLTLYDADGDPISVFSAGDLPTSVIWSGGSTSSLATPLVEWIDPGAGTLRLTLLAADLAALDVQPYPIRILLDHSGSTLEVWRGWLDVQPEPASATVLPVYSTFRDMLDLAGEWLKRYVMTSSYSGFQRERAWGRSTLDKWILARYRPDFSGGYDLTLYSSATAGEGPDPVIKGYLDADCLIVTDQVVEICSRLALSRVCETANEDTIKALAASNYRRASALAKTLVAQLDTNADGVADLTIPLGIINTRVN